jgi:hypothetical protein
MGTMTRTDTNPAHRDPKSGDPSSRPVGAAAGSAFNPSVHDVYWREAFRREPYYTTDYTYDDFAPAYRTGYEAAGRYHGENRRFDDLEPELRADFERTKGRSRLTWANAKNAVRAAWDRVEQVMPGDFDNDGR